jgi:hypothetical protein
MEMPIKNAVSPLLIVVSLLYVTYPSGGGLLSSVGEPITTAGAIGCVDGVGQDARSKTVVGPGGGRAFAEVRNGRWADANTVASCQTAGTLHVALANEPFVPQLVGDRSDTADKENAFDLIGWSADGDMLLGSQVVAAGDWDETTPVIYSMKESRLWRISLAPLFGPLAAEGCKLHFEPLGFSRADNVVLRVSAVEKPHIERGSQPCFPDGTWLLDFRNKTVTRAPTDTQVESVGQIEK